MILKWYTEAIQRDLYTDPTISEQEFEQRIFANFADNIDFKFQYLFSVSVCCLIFRIATMLQYSESIGPLMKILAKMMINFLTFLFLYGLLILMFALVGNINFMFALDEFESFFGSFLTIFNASMGNYDLAIYN